MTLSVYQKLLRDPRWQTLRREVLALDGHACSRCDKRGASMHVHHKQYIAGRKPWEYPVGLLEALCAGCHAAEHGIIPPPCGWVFVWVHDLDELSGECEFCRTSIRYECTIHHEDWGYLVVGTDCCDRMTGTTMASDLNRAAERRRRFVESPRWRTVRVRLDGDVVQADAVNLAGISAIVYPVECAFGRETGYGIAMSCGGPYQFGSLVFQGELDARGHVYDAIASGEAAQYLRRVRASTRTAGYAPSDASADGS